MTLEVRERELVNFESPRNQLVLVAAGRCASTGARLERWTVFLRGLVCPALVAVVRILLGPEISTAVGAPTGRDVEASVDVHLSQKGAVFPPGHLVPNLEVPVVVSLRHLLYFGGADVVSIPLTPVVGVSFPVGTGVGRQVGGQRLPDVGVGQLPPPAGVRNGEDEGVVLVPNDLGGALRSALVPALVLLFHEAENSPHEIVRTCPTAGAYEIGGGGGGAASGGEHERLLARVSEQWGSVTLLTECLSAFAYHELKLMSCESRPSRACAYARERPVGATVGRTGVDVGDQGLRAWWLVRAFQLRPARRDPPSKCCSPGGCST
ncbi:TPA: hypothetical protein DEP96_02165 [Candidatus Uhrbacteria bacterium]|nr:hypothetical protein [Candidatus Uhrbacteria bacterium]